LRVRERDDDGDSERCCSNERVMSFQHGMLVSSFQLPASSWQLAAGSW
jgi:hypothetical protein